MENDPSRLIESTINFIYQVLAELEWPDLETVIASCRQEQPVSRYGVTLPILTAIGSGGSGEQAVPLAAAWLLYNQASNLFDDLQDRDNKPLIWNEWDPTRASQVGLGLIAAAQVCLARIETFPEAQSDILQTYAATLAAAAREQAATPTSPDLSAYFQHIIGKSGLIFATVAWSGVRVHSREPQAMNAMWQYGMSLGILIQLLDDCRDLNNSQLQSDLFFSPYTLPVLYALSYGGQPRQAQLASLLQQSMTQDVVGHISEILNDVGAFSYSVAMMKVYEQKALDALSFFPTERVAPLVTYVSSFLNSVGVAI